MQYFVIVRRRSEMCQEYDFSREGLVAGIAAVRRVAGEAVRRHWHRADVRGALPLLEVECKGDVKSLLGTQEADSIEPPVPCCGLAAGSSSKHPAFRSRLVDKTAAFTAGQAK